MGTVSLFGRVALPFLVTVFLFQACCVRCSTNESNPVKVPAELEATPWCAPQVEAALAAGDARDMARLGMLGLNLDCRADNEFLLMRALRVKEGKVAYEITKTLKNTSSQLTARNNKQKTALLLAAEHGFAEAVTALLALNVRPDVSDTDQRTALHHGAPWPLVVEELIRKHKEVMFSFLGNRDGKKNAPLHYAVRGKAPQSARQLITLANDETLKRLLVGMEDGAGDYPMHWCNEPGLMKELEALGGSLVKPNREGALPFLTIAGINGTKDSGALEMAYKKSNSKMDRPDNLGRTALHYAARAGATAEVTWLLDEGADPSARGVDQQVPLTYALQNGFWNLVQVFSRNRGSPLTAVTLLGRLDVLKGLVFGPFNNGTGGTPANTTDPVTGRTALFEAAQVGRNDILEFLMGENVSVHQLDFAGHSVLESAVRGRHRHSVRYLLNRSTSVMQRLQDNATALHAAADRGDAGVIEELVSWNADIMAVDRVGRTPLHNASTGEAVRQLVALGATQEPTTGAGLGGMLPLHTAAMLGRAEVIRALLAWQRQRVNEPIVLPNKSDTRPAGTQGIVAVPASSALHLAAANGHIAAVTELLRWCADPRRTDSLGRMPQQVTREWRLNARLDDAASSPGRCLCDCGPYVQHPDTAASGWTVGCAAVVRCRRAHTADSIAAGVKYRYEETLRCEPAAALKNASLPPPLGRWLPPHPQRMRCATATSAAAGLPRSHWSFIARVTALLWLSRSGAVALPPFR
eukprot:TRINITY_DN72556_c0_g1_i1.p1 TRINITY_DN72556_c0_g1~~TRINITY_DN72556_c0_g1_i1.p1  ORF type:complete len:752 (+),score=150.85 TRINITY_DN72556_c0_g1_i1:196-2451(+)